MTKLAIGAAVDFTATATGGNEIRLNDLRARKIVLFFYPRANTPGCTQESQDFRDLHAQFQNENVIVLGASRDSLKAQENFKTKHSMPFDLIADPEERLCRLFDVIKEKNMYGKKVLGIERSTFLIDGDGVLRHEWRGVKVKGHADEVLATARTL